MFKLPPTDRTDIFLLKFFAACLVFFLLLTGAVALARHGLDTLGAVSASCYGIGLLISIYGLLWGRQHAKVILLLVLLAMGAGGFAVTLQALP